MHATPDVTLITRDPQLWDAVARARPPDRELRCQPPDEPTPAVGEFWIDLDCATGREGLGSGRRVYFYSSNVRPPKDLPPGLFIRKPCAGPVVQVLWAGVDSRRGAPRHHAGHLPAWIVQFHDIRLRELCRKCVGRLPGRLGYAHASLYLLDHEAGVLTLAETTHTRAIDLQVPWAGPDRHLMVAVARQGQLLETAHADREQRARNLPSGNPSGRYRDGACLIAPLVSGGQLWGVLNLSERLPGARARPEPLEPIFAFIARSLRYARAHERARTEARVDALTGLYNQRWMFEALTKEIQRCQRFGSPLSLIVADVDGLKAVNDRVGHSGGDCLLRHVASRISSALRQFDSAARVGGDEFVVLLPATDLEGARQVARRVLEAIRHDAAVYRGVSLPVRASLGVVEWQKGWDTADLLEAGDQAMYLAKHQGRDQLVCRAPAALPPGPLPADVSRRLWGDETRRAALTASHAAFVEAERTDAIAGI